MSWLGLGIGVTNTQPGTGTGGGGTSSVVGLSTTNLYTNGGTDGIVLSNGTPPLTFSTYSGSANHQMVSADTAKSGSIRQWEVTLTGSASASQPALGMYPGTVNFNQVPSPEPGRTGQPNGFFFCFNNNGASFFSAYNTVSAGSGSWAYAAGDTVTIIWDSVGHTIKVGIYKAGTWHLFATATGVTDTTLCPYVGADSNLGAGTVNFGASAFNYALSNTAGAVAYNS